MTHGLFAHLGMFKPRARSAAWHRMHDDALSKEKAEAVGERFPDALQESGIVPIGQRSPSGSAWWCKGALS